MPIGNKNKVIQGCGSHHVAIQTRDWDASLKLYCDVLGMEIVSEFGSIERKIVLLDMGDGSHIELFQPKADTPTAIPTHSDPIMHIALATTDTRAATEHVRKAGYEITFEPKDLVLGKLSVTIAFFKGPNGEELEFFQTH
jgi:catechol 2,3-dioxygenase-like lactoylglutathione lyase family enzyme